MHHCRSRSREGFGSLEKVNGNLFTDVEKKKPTGGADRSAFEEERDLVHWFS
jgi:hypothetical protein